MIATGAPNVFGRSSTDEVRCIACGETVVRAGAGRTDRTSFLRRYQQLVIDSSTKHGQ